MGCGQKHWSPALRAEVERLRLDFPMWGKEKLGPILRDQASPSPTPPSAASSTAWWPRGRVPRVGDLIGKATRKSQPNKRPHAIRKPKDVSFEKPGDVVQIDTLTVALTPNLAVKHFDAGACPRAGRRPDPGDVHAKWTVAKPYRHATAQNAADFLDKVTAEMPWPIKAIQIDGGSEFMAEFETACAAKAIPLYVLPPRSPKLNGAVERCNGAWRYEFYSVADLPNESTKSLNTSMPSSTSTTTSDRTVLSTAKPQTNIFKSAQPTNAPRLICLEPGHDIASQSKAVIISAAAVNRLTAFFQSRAMMSCARGRVAT